MKVTAPTDLHGRMINVGQRLTMLTESLAGLASAYRDIGPPSEAALEGFADAVEEMRDEMTAIEDAYVEESNREYAAKHGGTR